MSSSSKRAPGRRLAEYRAVMAFKRRRYPTSRPARICSRRLGPLRHHRPKRVHFGRVLGHLCHRCLQSLECLRRAGVSAPVGMHLGSTGCRCRACSLCFAPPWNFPIVFATVFVASTFRARVRYAFRLHARQCQHHLMLCRCNHTVQPHLASAEAVRETPSTRYASSAPRIRSTSSCEESARPFSPLIAIAGIVER